MAVRLLRIDTDHHTDDDLGPHDAVLPEQVDQTCRPGGDDAVQTAKGHGRLGGRLGFARHLPGRHMGTDWLDDVEVGNELRGLTARPTNDRRDRSPALAESEL